MKPLIGKARTKSATEMLIRMTLLQRGLRLSDLARQANVSVGFVSMLISGRRHSDKIKNRVCRLLGLSREVLWSENKKED